MTANQRRAAASRARLNHLVTKDLFEVISPLTTFVQFSRAISVKSKPYKHQAATSQWRNAPHILTVGQVGDLMCCSMEKVGLICGLWHMVSIFARKYFTVI